MKRLIQFAAVATIALMAALPLAEGLACLLTMGAGTAACPMGMSQMRADCPMGQHMAEDGCAQDCCNHSLPKIAVQWAAPAKPKDALFHPAALELAADASLAQNESLGTHFELPIASSPPRYILNRIFRI